MTERSIKTTRRTLSIGLLSVVCAAPFVVAADQIWPARLNPQRAQEAARRTAPILAEMFSKQGIKLGVPVFIRILKQEKTLELFGQASDGTFKLLKNYPICSYSGSLGPKLREGDAQAPEGFYFVTADRLNPFSRFHLSFNIGFPNAYDRAHGRTGSFLMVHGSCVSVGCYAMTDSGIEEIYSAVNAALSAGQPFIRVHIFPFAMSDATMTRFQDHPWIDFWINLKAGYDHFERTGKPPNIEVTNGRYIVTDDV